MRISCININIPKRLIVPFQKKILPSNDPIKLKSLENDVFEKREGSSCGYEFAIQEALDEQDIFDDPNIESQDDIKTAQEYVELLKSKTLESNINLFELSLKQKFYSVPLNFAMLIHNSLVQKGNAHIIDEIPDIFKGLDIKEVFRALNEFADSEKPYKKKIRIGNKTFSFKYINEGSFGAVYKISGKNGEPVAIKVFKKPIGISYYDALNEIPTIRQLSKDKVNNVPKFYMARANCYELNSNKKVKVWIIEDYVNKKTPQRKDGITLSEWLDKNGAAHLDLYNYNIVGKYIVDVGGIKTSKPNVSAELLTQLRNFFPAISNYYRYV